jgi:hypothetical protein
MVRITENWHFETVSFTAITLPSSSIANGHIVAGAGIEAEKLEHLHSITGNQPNSAATTETRVIFNTWGATGDVIAFEAGSIVAAIGDSVVTLDLKKNGTTILTGLLTLDNANTPYVAEAAAIDTAGLVDGDVLTVVIVATIGTGTLPTGLFYNFRVNEDAQ